MSGGNGEHLSFVNENFDDFQSEGSKESIPQKDQPESSEAYEKGDDRDLSLDIETIASGGNEDIQEEGSEGVAVLHLSSEEPATLDATTVPDATTVDEGEKEYNPFAPESSPIPKTKDTTNLVAPSFATASPSGDDRGNESDDGGNNHRQLPPMSPPLKYESLGAGPTNTNELRHENTDQFDLQISITGHEKQVLSKTDSFIVYKISTTSLRPRHLFDKCEYLVHRRYRDFEWLHTQLERTYPTLILPPLPGKQIMRLLDHKNELFLEERQKCLDQFLWRLASHPYYSYDHSFKMFLTASTEEFAAHVDSTSTNNQILGMVSSSVKMASTTMRLKNPDQNFAPHGKYFSSLSESFGVLDRIEARISLERADLASSYEDMSALSFSWANSEAQLSEPIRKMGGIFEANASALCSLNQSNSSSFQLALKMYQLYSSSAASAVKRRDALQLQYELACDERDKKKKIHNDAVSAGKTDKLPKLAADMEKTGVAAEHALDELMKSNEQLRVDIEKWLEAKDVQLEEIFRNWSDNHIHYHERMFHEWEELLLMLRQLGTAPPTENLYESV